ncbi:MAG: ferric reductase-like transmembrane domain-containing protein [Planctomycetes bacterium]|nr:ferric reductase-like transmembrane domain-containing protein [Planctomycetota bacterium]
MKYAVARIALYIFLLLAPLSMAAVFGPGGHGFLGELGRSFALLAFTIVTMQFVLSARLSWIERPFGLDMLFRFHKAMAVFATVLLLLHPVLLAAGGAGWALLIGFDVPWHIWLGRLVLLVLLTLVGISWFRLALCLEYERWRRWHNALAVLLLALGFVHSWNAGRDPTAGPLRFLWPGLVGAAALAYLYHRVVRPFWLWRHPYRVVEVIQETPEVWTIKLRPPEGRRLGDYLPGQFCFLTLKRGRGLPTEEHHWTISSSPTEQGFITFTIKESGDFTATIGQTRPGDTAAVLGPYGRFSYVLHPEEGDLIFIAGGIGITPLMSMLRHMRDTRADRCVLLIYANTTQSDIAFRDELAAIEAGASPRLQVIHILSRPEAGWAGETGRLDRAKVERLCGKDVADKAYYVCGPPAMMTAVLAILQELGAAQSAVQVERFSLFEN